jgi:lipopolysaccharide cholinephosphotransferase
MQGARLAISIFKRGEESPSALQGMIDKTFAIAVAVITSPITAAGAVLKAVGSQFPYRVENLTADQIQKTPAHKIDQIYELLKTLDGLLRETNIDYSMDGGTLLGAVRHQGIIPWDDDGDIMIMKQDKARFLALRDRLREKGIVLHDMGIESFKVTFDAATLRSQFSLPESAAANVDIFLMEEDPDGIVRPASAYNKHTFPKEYFPREELQNLRDYAFGPPNRCLFLKGPANPMRYLKTFYGPECFTYALQTHSHIQIGPFPFPILNFSKTRYKIVNPTFAEGNNWKNA